MSITYLRNRAREMRHARTEAEYQESLEKLQRVAELIGTVTAVSKVVSQFPT